MLTRSTPRVHKWHRHFLNTYLCDSLLTWARPLCSYEQSRAGVSHVPGAAERRALVVHMRGLAPFLRCRPELRYSNVYRMGERTWK